MLNHWETTLLTIVNSVYLIVGSLANFLVVISCFLYTPNREATDLFLLSLSVADFLICAACQPFLIIRINWPAPKRFVTSAMSVSGYGLMIASFNGVLAVTVDRVVSICLPLKYTHWMNERNARTIISASWVTSATMVVLHSANVGVVNVVTQVYIAAIYVLVPLFYCVIYKEARKQSRRIAEQYPTSPAVHRGAHKATKGVGLVILTTMLSWLPVTLYPPLAASHDLKGQGFLRWFFWCVTATSLNSCINPFLYYWQFSKFRRAVGKSFRRMWFKGGGNVVPISPCAG